MGALRRRRCARSCCSPPRSSRTWRGRACRARVFETGLGVVDLPRQVHPHALRVPIGLQPAGPGDRGARGVDVADRPRRDRARDRRDDRVPHRGRRHPRRHVPRRGPRATCARWRRRSRRATARACSLQRPAVINLQCDLDHPTQSLADLGHLVEHFGSLEALRGKRLAMTLGLLAQLRQAAVGAAGGRRADDARSAWTSCWRIPRATTWSPEPLEAARRFAAQSGGSFAVADSMADAFAGADIVYPKSWAPAAIMRERTRLLRAGGDGDARRAGARGAGEERAAHATGSAPRR